MSLGRRVAVAVLLALGTHVAGCAPLLQTPNHRRLTWDGAVAEMELPRPDQGYASLSIRLTDPERDFRVRMPDGRWLRTTGLEPATVEPYASPLLGETLASGTRRLIVLFDRDGCASVLGFVGGSIAFEFDANRLVRIQLTSNVGRPEHCRPGLADGEGEQRYSMPLSEDRLVALLGPFLRKEDFYGGL